MKKPDLKPCPFCGGKASLFSFQQPDGSTSYEVHKIQGTNNTCAGIESEDAGGNAVVTPNLKYVSSQAGLSTSSAIFKP